MSKEKGIDNQDFFQILDFLKDKQKTNKEKLDFLNKLVEYSKSITNIENIITIEDFIKKLRLFLVDSSRTLRTACLRVLRYYSKNSKFLKVMFKLKLHYFISRSLERDKQSEGERMQALKLIRKIIEIDCDIMPYNMVHSLISIVEYNEDHLSRIALEILCEITIRSPRISSHCGAIKVLLNAIIDPNYQGIQESLVLTIIYVLNNLETRKYIRPIFDIGIILAPLSNNFNINKEQIIEKEKKWNASIKAISIMLKSWVGLIALTSNSMGLKSFVDTFRLPCVELHDRILDSLFDIFRLTVEKNSNPFHFDAQKKQNYHEDEISGSDITDVNISYKTKEKFNLLNNYLSALLIAFIDCGLIEALIYLGSKNRYEKVTDKEENNISIKATLLLGELLFLSNSLLPSSLCAYVQTLPKLVEFAASFNLDPRIRSRAATMVTNLYQYHHLKHISSFYDFHLSLIVTGANKWKRLKGRDKRLDRMDEVKLKIDFGMDIDQLKNKIQESQILTTKDYQKWKWDIISDLIEGPLNNPNLANYILTKTKFVSRIFSFLRPSHKLFCKLSWSTKNLKYVRIVCQLLEILVSLQDNAGRDFLKDSKLMREIAEMLNLEVEYNQKGDESKLNKENRLLSSEKLLKTMTREYFTMIGTLSSSPRGLEILNKFKIFKYLIDLCELPGRDDLTNLIMTSLDYNLPDTNRVILAKTLTSSSKVVRYYATRHMKILFRVGVQDFSEWGIDLLVKQLNDQDIKIAQVALNILDEACDELDYLEKIIDKKPSYSQLLRMGQAGKNLWLRFLSIPNGFHYLNECGFIKEELQLWKEKLNITYVNNIENSLSETFTPSIYKQRESELSDGVFLPPHFYGELAKTKEGCQVLEESSHISEFMECITNKSQNISNIEKRSALWALGNICSSETGFQLLKKTNFIEILVELAENCLCLSIRGTCFYILGIISRNEFSRNKLSQLGWETPNNINSGICAPKNMKNPFFKIPEYHYEGSFVTSNLIQYPEENNEIRKEILKNVVHLSNFISAERASRTLKRIKNQYPEQFQSYSLFMEVFKLLSTYKFRLPVRRFIYEIFDGVNFSEEVLEKIN